MNCKVDIFTDGACSGNPGAGGWAAILKHGSSEKVLSGGCESTTNNRMELTAVVEALNALNRPCSVTLTTDSKYVVDAIKQGWLQEWKARGWTKKDGKRAANSDLWEELLVLLDAHEVSFEWVKGHDGHPENERCDGLARQEIKRLK